MTAGPLPMLIFAPRKTGIYAFHVLLGALELRDLPRRLDIRFAKRPRELREWLLDAKRTHRPVLVAWSFFSPAFPAIEAELAELRVEVDAPWILHLAGGVHATAEPQATLTAGFDYVALGEGERLIAGVVLRWLRGEDIAEVAGIACLREGRYRANGFGERVDLDAYPPFAPETGRFNPIEITRGCVYACRFCQTPYMFKARFRHRSVDAVCRWTQVLRARGMRDIRFLTPTALSYGSEDETMNLAAVEALLAAVRGAAGAEGRIFFGSFPAEVRPEHVTGEAVALLKRYVHNDNLVIGAQSGSQKVLDLLKRGHGTEEIEAAVRHTVEAGFIAYVDFMFGLPGEEPDDVEASLVFAERLAGMGAVIHAHTFMPLPGTPFKDAPPGTIADQTRRRISHLASAGKLFGQWQPQQQIAQRLSELRQGGS